MKQWAKYVAILALACIGLPGCESDVVEPVIDDGYTEDDDSKTDPKDKTDDPETSEECLEAANGTPCTGEDEKACGKWLCMNKACILVPKDNGTVCRAAAGDCDAEEVCDGTSMDCPEDVLKTASDVCREAEDDCDEAEYCDGVSAACPADVKDTTSVQCGGTEVVEDCTSIADGTPCVGEETACGKWECRSNECSLVPVAAGKVCRQVADECDIEDVCDGTSTECPEDIKDTTSAACVKPVEDCTGVVDDTPCIGEEKACGKWICLRETCALLPRESGYVCRKVAGDCDVEDVCDGTAVDCPADVVKAAGDECRAVADSCDIAEVCDGVSAACPADVRDTTSEGCEPPPNECSGQADGVACTGEVKACGNWMCMSETCTLMPKAMGSVCRNAAGDCDVEETCDGVSTDCPADVLKAAGETCRSKAGTCDIAETCDGMSPACPEDVKDTASDGCRPVEGECALRANGTPCSGGETECGQRVCMNKECVLMPKTGGTVCRRAEGECDLDDVCDGVTTECPDKMKDEGAECRPAEGVCDVAEYCTGTSKECPADTFLGASEECRPAVDELCDVAEYCSGTSKDCPEDEFAPADTECRPVAGKCDAVEYCTGSSPTCPPDRYAASSIECRPASGACDAPEYCSGSSATCPEDSFKSSGTQCSSAQYTCDSADYCDGKSKTCTVKLTNSCSCPAPNKVASGYGLVEGSGVTPFKGGASDYRGFFLKDADTWTTNDALIKGFGTGIEVANLTYDQAMTQVTKSDSFYTNISAYQGFKRAYRWNSTDENVSYWGPQGISSGMRGDREFKVVGWHYEKSNAGSDPSPASDQSDKDKGSRVTFIDTSSLSSVKYTHALLADISSGKLVPIKNNAGGLAWSWPYLYVASTSKGLRVFDMRTILKADTSNDCKTRIGTYNGKLCAYGLPYILVQMNAYSQPGASGTNCDLKFSYISIERRSGSNNSILAGEYYSNSGNESTCMYSRLVRFPMKSSGGKLSTNSYGIVEPEGGWFTGTCNIQGATSNNDTFLLSSTRKYGSLYASRSGQAKATTYNIKSMPQGIHVTAKDNAWFVASGRSADSVTIPRLVFYLDATKLTP